MKRLRVFRYISFTAVAVSLAACYSTNKVSVQNLAAQYRPDYHYLHPEYTLYHVNDTLSLLYFKIDEGELLYIKRNQADSFTASVKIYCKVTASYDADMLQDTNTVSLKFASATNTKKEYTVGAIPLKIRAGSTHLVTIYTNDEVSKKFETTYINADKTSPNCDENFLLRDPVTGYVVFSRFVDSATTYAISCNRPATRFYINYYKRDFPTAAPPFSTVESKPFIYKPDSSFILNAASSGVALINLKGEGFYHIGVDSNSHYGITIYRFPKHFPTIGEAYQMMMPLRYITTNDEYEHILKAANVKTAIDEFWLNTGGNTKERARALVRNYYNRVQDANKYFTSYEEGWKTDRGMVFIVYGAPNVIYRSANSETWTYGEDKNYMTLSFTFVKTNNPFTDNDYTLQRQQQYRNLWYNAVDVWREGRVY
ncbi:MAG TPA: GWxTD domain-containing protein [Bacteroidia bacterium]|jgi:GWxTD domain-containing protein|nr:GWxTD domain-containing protein [Bacteroidia bacterium]